MPADVVFTFKPSRWTRLWRRVRCNLERHYPVAGVDRAGRLHRRCLWCKAAC